MSQRSQESGYARLLLVLFTTVPVYSGPGSEVHTSLPGRLHHSGQSRLNGVCCMCAANLAVTLSTFARLGVPIASEKSESSSTCITFLGKEVDFQMMELRLPKEKLQRARAVVQQWLGRKAAKWRDLKSLEIYTSATCGESGTIWSQLCAAHYTTDGISQEQRSTTL